MAIRKMRFDSDPILRKKSQEVENIDNNIKTLIKDMFDTMYDFNGVGLSAVQVGILKRILVVDTGNVGEKIAIINPVIKKVSGHKMCSEGCLSFPNIYGNVLRPTYILVEGLDEDGKKIKVEATDFFAQALSHEINHLDGILFIDLVDESSLTKEINGKHYSVTKDEVLNNTIYKN